MSMRNAGGIDDAGLNPAGSAEPIQFPESKLSRSIGLSGQLADELAKNDIAVPPMAIGTAGTDGPANPNRGLAPIPAVLSTRLYDMEETLLALVDTEELVTEDKRAEYLATLAAGMQTTKEKRDRYGATLKELDKEAQFSRAEAKRMTERARALENALELARKYGLYILDSLKLKSLKGHKFTISTRVLAPKVDITDESQIPHRFKRATVTIPAEIFHRYRGVMVELGLIPDRFGGTDVTVWSVDEDALREYLEGAPDICESCEGKGSVLANPGEVIEYIADCPVDVTCSNCNGAGVIPPSVPGARLLTDRNSLVLR